MLGPAGATSARAALATRWSGRIALVAVLASALLMPTAGVQPAEAQSFLERLFGIGQSQPGARPRFRRYPGARPIPGFPFGRYFNDRRGDADPERRRGAWRYRTVCVRMCDGYFFPISFSVPRSAFSTDAQACAARCPGQGKLFHMASPNGTLEDARASDGQRYTDIANAFVYRERLVNNCACRPEPWSHSERLRHAMYSSPNAVDGADATDPSASPESDGVGPDTDLAETSPNEAQPVRSPAASRRSAVRRTRASRRVNRPRQGAPQRRFNPFDAYGHIRAN